MADLDQDGACEILITTRNDGVLCLRADGKRWWRSAPQDHIPWGSASVVDANRDGRPDEGVAPNAREGDDYGEEPPLEFLRDPAAPSTRGGASSPGCSGPRGWPESSGSSS